MKKGEKGFLFYSLLTVRNLDRRTTTLSRDNVSLKLQHEIEIRALLLNTLAKTAPDRVGNLDNVENEATMAVKELDGFKTKTVKVRKLILKLGEIVECARNEKREAEERVLLLEEDIQQKEKLLHAKSFELRRRHGRTIEQEKSLHEEILTLKKEKEVTMDENAKLHEVCKQKDLRIHQKVQELKALEKEMQRRNSIHQQNLARLKNKVEEAWGLYETVKSRAEKRTAEFSEAAERLKASQGHLLDLWQTLKTVDSVVETSENNEL